jgi:hypothetical protein
MGPRNGSRFEMNGIMIQERAEAPCRRAFLGEVP